MSNVGSAFLAGADMAQTRGDALDKSKKAEASKAASQSVDSTTQPTRTSTTAKGPMEVSVDQPPASQSMPENPNMAMEQALIGGAPEQLQFARAYSKLLRKHGFADDAFKYEKESLELAGKQQEFMLNSMIRSLDLIAAGNKQTGLTLMNGLRENKDDPVIINAWAGQIPASVLARLRVAGVQVDIPNVPADESNVFVLNNRGEIGVMNTQRMRKTLTDQKTIFQAQSELNKTVAAGVLDLQKSVSGDKETINSYYLNILKKQDAQDRLRAQNWSNERIRKERPDLLLTETEGRFYTGKMVGQMGFALKQAADSIEGSLRRMGTPENKIAEETAKIMQSVQGALMNDTTNILIAGPTKQETKTGGTVYVVPTKAGDREVTEEDLRKKIKADGKDPDKVIEQMLKAKKWRKK